MTLPGRLPELSLENLLLPAIPFSFGVFPKADAFSPQVISYKPLERTTSGTSCGSSIHSKSTEWPQSHLKHSECHNVNTEITSHHDFYVNWCSLFASGEIEMLGITSRFSGCEFNLQRAPGREGEYFFFPQGLILLVWNILEDGKPSFWIITYVKDKGFFKKLYLESNSAFSFQEAAGFLLEPFTLTLSVFKISLFVSPAPGLNPPSTACSTELELYQLHKMFF